MFPATREEEKRGESLAWRRHSQRLLEISGHFAKRPDQPSVGLNRGSHGRRPALPLPEGARARANTQRFPVRHVGDLYMTCGRRCTHRQAAGGRTRSTGGATRSLRVSPPRQHAGERQLAAPCSTHRWMPVLLALRRPFPAHQPNPVHAPASHSLLAASELSATRQLIRSAAVRF